MMLTFKRNMGTLDRILRLIVGITLLTIGPATNILKLASPLEIFLGIIGVFAILSAMFAYCILYEFTKSDTSS